MVKITKAEAVKCNFGKLELPMSTKSVTLKELKKMLLRLDQKWKSGNIGSPSEIVRLDRERRQLERRIQELEYD